MRKEAAKTTQAQSSHFPGESLATLLERVPQIQSLLSAKSSCTKFPWDFAILLFFKKSSNLSFFLSRFRWRYCCWSIDWSNSGSCYNLHYRLGLNQEGKKQEVTK